MYGAYSPDPIEYSGNNKTYYYTIPADGNYKLEVWGAESDGYGGYSVGTVYLHKGDELCILLGYGGGSSYSQGG